MGFNVLGCRAEALGLSGLGFGGSHNCMYPLLPAWAVRGWQHSVWCTRYYGSSCDFTFTVCIGDFVA